MQTSARRRRSFGSRVALAAALCCVVSACTGSRAGLRIPRHERVYVAVFVDETPTGEVGIVLAEAIQMAVYTRDPARLAMTFDEGTLALDGTVHALVERDLGAGEREVAIRTTVVLVDKQGRRIGAIGPVESRSSYEVSDDDEETAAARREAIARASRTLAGYVTGELDAQARAMARDDAARQRGSRDDGATARDPQAFFLSDFCALSA